jgi:hypothetical protein
VIRISGVAWAIVGVATAALVYRALLAERQFVDDLFIYLRYARALAETGELAFSPGERVEGVSSVAWTFVLAAMWKCGLRGVAAAKGASLVAMAALPAACAIAVKRAAPSRPLAMSLPAVALALDADVATWGASGMDTAAWTLACAACVAIAGAGARGAAVALGLLAWVRPEGPLFAAFGAGAIAIVAARTSRRDALVLVALAAAPVLALTVARLAYFHDWLPNTFFAKMRAVDGRDYDGVGYVTNAIARRPLLFALGAVGAIGAARARRPLVLALLAAAIVFPLAARGDWMMNRRLLVPALPLAAIGVAVGWAHATRARSERGIAWVTAAAALLLFGEASLSTTCTLDQTWRTREYLDRRLDGARITWRPLRDPYPLDWMPTHLMKEIAPYVAAGDTVAHVDVGELPYVMQSARFLDGFGLVDREAGRLTFFPGDPGRRAAAREAFFAKDPVVAIVVLDDDGRAFSTAQDAAIQDARFAARWRELARVPSWGDHPCVTFVRRDREAASAAIADARVRAWLAAVPDVVAAF